MKRAFRSVRRGAALAAVGLAVAALPGCGLWDAWADFWGLRPKPKVISTRSPFDTPERINTTTTVKLVKVRMLRMALPVGTVSANEKIWRQLDEDALDSQTSVMLAQNGLRAGIAPLPRWAGVSKLLDVPAADAKEYLCQTDGKTPLNVTVRDAVGEQIIVSIDRDSVQQGRTFENCDNAFRLSLSQMRTKPDLIVQIEPVVQFGADGGRRAPAAEVTFADMRLWTALKPDQFLMVAPADPKANRFSIGTRFLSNNEKVPPTETVLVFVPLAE